MKKLLILTMTAVLGLMLAGCAKVEPTSVEYKYTATAKGSVEYANGNSASGFEVALNVTGAPQTKYHVVTGSDGKFSVTIPCLGKDGIQVTASVQNFVYKGKKYSSTKSVTKSVDAGETSESMELTLNDGVSVE